MSFRPASSKLPCLTQARTFKIAKKRTMCRRRDMQCSRSPPLPLFGSPPLGINEEHNALSVLQHVGTQSGGDGVWRSLPLPHNKICHYTTTMFVPVTTSTPERLHDARRPARGVAASAFAMLRQPRLCHPGPVKTVTIVTRSFAALQVSARCCRASVRTAGTIRLCHPGANRGPGPQARRQARHSLLVSLSILVCLDFFCWVFHVRNVRHPGAPRRPAPKARRQARRSRLPTAVLSNHFMNTACLLRRAAGGAANSDRWTSRPIATRVPCFV